MTAGPWCSDPGEGLQKGEEKGRKYFQSSSQGTRPWAWLPQISKSRATKRTGSRDTRVLNLASCGEALSSMGMG